MTNDKLYFVELTRHTLTVARVGNGIVEKARECVIDNKPAVEELLSDIKPSWREDGIKAFVSLAPNPTGWHLSSVEEARTSRKEDALKKVVAGLNHGIVGELEITGCNAEDGAMISPTATARWLLAFSPKESFEAAIAVLAEWKITPERIESAGLCRIGAIAAAQRASAGAPVVLWDLGPERSTLTLITSRGVESVADCPVAFNEIFAGTQTLLALKFKAAAARLFFNDTYDFTDAGSEIAQAVAPGFRKALALLVPTGASPAIACIGVTAKQAWFVREIAGAVNGKVWSDDPHKLAAQWQIKLANGVTMPDSTMGLLHLIAAYVRRATPWHPTWRRVAGSLTQPPMPVASEQVNAPADEASASPAPAPAPAPIAPAPRSSAGTGLSEAPFPHPPSRSEGAVIPPFANKPMPPPAPPPPPAGFTRAPFAVPAPVAARPAAPTPPPAPVPEEPGSNPPPPPGMGRPPVPRAPKPALKAPPGAAQEITRAPFTPQAEPAKGPAGNAGLKQDPALPPGGSTPPIPADLSRRPAGLGMRVGILAAVVGALAIGILYYRMSVQRSEALQQQKQAAAERLESDRRAQEAVDKAKAEEARMKTEEVRAKQAVADAARQATELERKRLLAQIEQEKLNKSPGSLAISTDPEGANVTIDGKNMGRTPATIDELMPGTHHVHIELANFESLDLHSEIRGTKTTDLGTIPLQSSVGSMSVDSSPDGIPFSAKLKDKPDAAPLTGMTPVTLDAVPPGDYTVTFYRDNWPDEEETVSVYRRNAAKVSFIYNSLTIQISTTPSGVMIYRGSQAVGRSPATLLDANPARSITFQLTLPGYEPYSLTGSVMHNGTMVLHADLVSLNRIADPSEVAQGPQPIDTPQPRLTEDQRQRAGPITLSVVVRRDGTVSDVHVQKSNDQAIAQKCAAVVSGWTYRPAVNQAGAPLNVLQIISIPSQ